MYKKQLWRFLEILPGTISWTIIVLPVFLGAYLPVYLAYFMIAFDFYWLIKAIMMGGYLISAYLHMKRDGKMWIRIFPDKPVTKKPLETRMGKGKGAPEFWVAVVKPGRIMFEIGAVDKKTAVEALNLASHKLPIKTKITQRPDLES